MEAAFILPILEHEAGTVLSWLSKPKNWAYVAVVGIGLAFAFMALTIRHDDRVIADQRGQVVASAQKAAATSAASDVVSRGADRDAQIQAKAQAHAETLAHTEGHDAPVARPLNDAGRRGLCDYAAYRDDPACVQLRGAHP